MKPPCIISLSDAKREILDSSSSMIYNGLESDVIIQFITSFASPRNALIRRKFETAFGILSDIIFDRGFGKADI